MKKQVYLNIKEYEKKLLGVDQGFRVLENFYTCIKQEFKFHNGDFSTKVYDYVQDCDIELKCHPSMIISRLEKIYYKVLAQDLGKNYNWYNDLRKFLYLAFGKDIKEYNIMFNFMVDIFIDIVVKGLMMQENYFNYYNLNFFISFLQQSIYLYIKNLEAAKNYTDLIIKVLKASNLITEFDNYFSLSDPKISLRFSATSLYLPKLTEDSQFSIKFGGFYGLTNLMSIVETNLVLGNYGYSSLFEFESFVDDNFSFENFDLKSKFIPELITLYVRKVLVNDFCLNTIIMSCFDSYVFSKNHQNILFDRFNPEFGLDSEFYNYIYNAKHGFNFGNYSMVF